MVEAALVTPLFFFIIFAIIEGGLLMRDTLTTANASREGARAAGAAANRPEADFFTLRSVEHGLEAMGLDRLDYVTVFRADGPGSQLPPGCDAASQAGVCNHYTAAAFFADLDDGGGNNTGNFRCGTLDGAWCPTDRETSLSAGTDFVGVHVQTQHEFITGIFGNGYAIGETTIIRLEPSSR
jgi:hypothetical protein